MDQPISAQVIGRRQRLRLALAIGLLLTIVLAAWGINRIISPSVAMADIRVSEVRQGSIANTINASGVVIPVHEEQVPSPIQTRVAHVHVKAGQEVAAGELLLELDDHTIRLAMDNLDEQIAQQEIRVQSLTLEMRQKQKQLASEIELLQLDLESAKVKLGRYQRLERIGASSASDLNAAELLVKRTEIELRQHRESVADTRQATETNIEGAQLQKSILQKELEQQRNLQAQTQVRAPFAGMLTWVLADEGASVSSGQLVAKVSELHNYRVEATASDFYARYLSPGQPVLVGYSGQTLRGQVQTILPEIQNGTITLLITLAQPNHPLLRNKLRVDANIITEQKANALVADAGPAFNGRGRQDVFVVDGGVARKKQLDVGLGDGKAVEIVSGAKAGDKLIVSDVSRYKHLDSIRVSN
ncbi:MAG TPA: HlyD family efflux transporter periplasmic adaptor subunit [Arenimonas sp.]|uniref:efflux RND transporter periplasmic adaptor subunit n=1 Tax=Arenimonas sp. TaxID=1872635 RepID=UPI002BCACF69|nr:HlyD family efflux transporter periplasmic adaptor subunit [Arenimonas sp.]HMB58008.1 HlyD family efflux transporter periplasmic adaptor subunit [Arenimonas sp.]